MPSSFSLKLLGTTALVFVALSQSAHAGGKGGQMFDTGTFVGGDGADGVAISGTISTDMYAGGGGAGGSNSGPQNGGNGGSLTSDASGSNGGFSDSGPTAGSGGNGAGGLGGLVGAGSVGSEGQDGINAGDGGGGGTGETGGRGGSGGGGGDAVLMSGDISINTGVTVHGGDGGEGGLNHGSGGEGGSGVTATSGNLALTNNGSIIGGDGGENDNTSYSHSGDGGVAVDLSGGPYTISNSGNIHGGNSLVVNANGYRGSGAAGVKGADLTITNSGSISGGLNPNNQRANAVEFTGGTNSFTYLAGSTVEGNVDATGGLNDTFALGGTTDGSFDASSIEDTNQYRGFETFKKTGSSTWTLAGSGDQNWTITEGVLEGHSNSIQGDVVVESGAQLKFNQSSSGTHSGNIEGAGSLIKTGVGTLTLAGTNNYYGGTTIQAGALRLDSIDRLGTDVTTLDGGALSLTHSTGTETASQLALGGNGGTLDVVNSGASLDVSSNLSGTGGLTKTGNGTLILSGANSYNGGTKVEAGTLQGDITSLNSHINTAANTSVVFDQDTNGHYLAIMWGAGSLVKEGSGTLILSGYNSYTGGTVINEGKVQGDAKTLQGDILTAASTSVEFVQSAAGTYADNMSGEGALEKYGSYNLTLTGTNSYSGGTTIGAGSLTGNTNSLQGDIKMVGSTHAIFDQNMDGTLSGDLSGEGSLVKLGTGTIVLTGSNTHTGGNYIVGGTVSVDNITKLGTGTSTFDGGTLSLSHATGTQTASSLALRNTGATLDVVNAGATLDVTSDLSGSAYLTKTGAGTLVLSGSNTYTGGTSVEAGRLKGTTDNVQGNVEIAANAELELDQELNGTFAGNISGGGQLIKSGVSNIMLTGTNSYAGGTLINGGLLSVSHMAQLGTGEVTLNGGTFQTTGNSDLSFDNFDLDSAGGELDVSSKSLALTGDISSTGELEKSGTGKLVLDGASNSVGGGTTVENGALIVGSSFGKSGVELISDVKVESSGVLGGHGTIKGNVTNNNGRIAPGNSIGVTTINGDYSGTGTLEIEVEGDTKLADKLVVNGNVDVSDTVLDLVLTPADKADWSLDPTGPFIIVENDGTDAITGEFSSIENNLLFLNAALDYEAGTDSNDIELTLLRNDIDFASAARTTNQKASAEAVQRLGSGSAVYNALIGTVSDETAAQAAFDSLSGEISASARGVLIENSRFVRNAVNDRLHTSAAQARKAAGAETAQLGLLALWNMSYGSWGEAKRDGNTAALDHSTGGVLFGVDGDAFSNLRVGLTGGYSRSSMDADDRASEATADTYTFGGYAGTQVNGFAVRTGAAVSWHQIDTERSVSISGGTFTDKLEADQSAATLQAFGELGYAFDFGATTLEPFAGLAHVHLISRSFAEDGGAAALSAGDQSTDVTFTTLGLRAASEFTLGGANLTARGVVGWQHASTDTVDFTQSFASGGSAFTVEGSPIAKDIGILEAGFDLAVNERTQFGLSYAGQLAAENSKHGVNARLSFEF
ncbi:MULTISPECIES: autotransporter domain-containing protein [unclassified Pseudovibrio]|uniref:autotransporter domain-containing protein n=1 Tax=unclassified Pseudovibrio TaxID=2627060 RepID=UPI0007AED1CD|nr:MULTISPECIES: autotransporter domain-containing protein [unclassified Pseudovibrio]KZL02248.1 Extracellular serine protease precursor [Pseudovibrio sp. W74]KZL08208.1 Extracellular serine protease precursor [Pseudovibrio sp. Ad14]